MAVNDLTNLLNSVDIPILILSGQRRIRSMNPVAERALGLIPADIGRPLSELRLSVTIPRLEQKISDVIQSLATHQEELQTQDGCWYSLRIRPYRTTDDRIDGAVMVLVDITERKRIEAHSVAEELTHSIETLSQAMVAAVRQPLLVLDYDRRIVAANAAFCQRFHLSFEAIEGHALEELGEGPWNQPPLRRLLERVARHDGPLGGLRLEYELPGQSHHVVYLTARRIDRLEGRPHLFLLAIEDVTDE